MTDQSTLIVDDEAIFRGLMCENLRRNGCAGPITEAEDGAAALRLASMHLPAVVLLDLNLPDLSGFEVAEILAHQSGAKPPKILLLTARTDDATLLRAASAPIAGMLWKSSCSLLVLREAITAVRAGLTYFHGSIRRALDQIRSAPDAIEKILSRREISLLTALGTGAPDAEIADRTGLTAACVRTRRHRIMQKLGLHSTPELMRWTRDMGFYDFSPSSYAVRGAKN